jgi:lysophospholipase L1-like esterase
MKKALLALCLVIITLSCAVLYLMRSHIPPTGFHGLDKWRATRVALYADNFAELDKYREQNREYKKTTTSANIVVFFGDSIIEHWNLDDSYPQAHYLNRGIRGQTTTQMLPRFHQDVIELKPRTVVILASNNDIAGNSGPMLMEDIHSNYEAMAELAKHNNIKLVFVSMLPVYNYTPGSQEYYNSRPLEKIKEINVWLRHYCLQNGFEFVDAYSAMIDHKGQLRKELAEDGLHPNTDGYKIIAPLVQAAITRSEGAAKKTPTENHRNAED